MRVTPFFLIAAVSLTGLHAQVATIDLDPYPSTPGDSLTLVVSGTGCKTALSPVQLSAGSIAVVYDDRLSCTNPQSFTLRLPVGSVPQGNYVARVVDREGQVVAETHFDVGTLYAPVPQGCGASDYYLCLQGERFSAWADLTDRSLAPPHGNARARLLSFASGEFYFFSSDNAELFIKIIDGCSINNHYWLYVAGLTDLGVTLRVRDLAQYPYHDYIITNPPGRAFVSRQDVNAFRCGTN